MRRAVLPLITLGLFAMVVADRLSHALAARKQTVVQGPSDTRSATITLRSNANSESSTGGTSATPRPVVAPTTPTIDRLARLAPRQQLSRSAGLTYLDSLISST